MTHVRKLQINIKPYLTKKFRQLFFCYSDKNEKDKKRLLGKKSLLELSRGSVNNRFFFNRRNKNRILGEKKKHHPKISFARKVTSK